MTNRGIENLAAEEITFEEAFARLEATVRQLEAGELSIDEAVRLYEEGVELARMCQQRLDTVELRISKLAPQSSGGYGHGGYGTVPLDAGW